MLHFSFETESRKPLGKITRLVVHITGWLYLLVANSYAMNQDLLNGQSYFPHDFFYYFIFYGYPLVFTLLVATVQARTDEQLANFNTKGKNSGDNCNNTCLAFIYLCRTNNLAYNSPKQERAQGMVNVQAGGDAGGAGCGKTRGVRVVVAPHCESRQSSGAPPGSLASP